MNYFKNQFSFNHFLLENRHLLSTTILSVELDHDAHSVHYFSTTDQDGSIVKTESDLDTLAAIYNDFISELSEQQEVSIVNADNQDNIVNDEAPVADNIETADESNNENNVILDEVNEEVVNIDGGTGMDGSIEEDNGIVIGVPYPVSSGFDINGDGEEDIVWVTKLESGVYEVSNVQVEFDGYRYIGSAYFVYDGEVNSDLNETVFNESVDELIVEGAEESADESVDVIVESINQVSEESAPVEVVVEI